MCQAEVCCLILLNYKECCVMLYFYLAVDLFVVGGDYLLVATPIAL